MSFPVYGGVLISVGLNVHMSMSGMSNGTQQWCPVEGGGCVSEVSFNRGFTGIPTLVSFVKG